MRIKRFLIIKSNYFTPLNFMLKQQDLDELLDIKGAAAYKGMRVQTFHKYMQTARGPKAYVLFGRSYFLPSDLDWWQAESVKLPRGPKKK